MIIADDLTGACDTGAAFAPGASVVLRDPPPDATALVYSTFSRNDPPSLAAAKVRELAGRLPAYDVLYKKIDSVLRGNIRAEVEALGVRPAIACTAFPEQGRTVRNRIAHPPNIDLATVLPAWVEIRDASTTEDLDAIAADALVRNPIPLLIGSAGLARAIARRAVPAPAALCPGPAVLIIGSTHNVTRAQIGHLRSHAKSSYIVHEIDMAAPSAAQLRMIRADLAAQRTGGLIVSGGDTARLILDLLDTRAIDLESEIAAGIPLGRLRGGAADGLPVITKSGGFGAPDALTCATHFLSAHNQ